MSATVTVSSHAVDLTGLNDTKNFEPSASCKQHKVVYSQMILKRTTAVHVINNESNQYLKGILYYQSNFILFLCGFFFYSYMYSVYFNI